MLHVPSSCFESIFASVIIFGNCNCYSNAMSGSYQQYKHHLRCSLRDSSKGMRFASTGTSAGTITSLKKNKIKSDTWQVCSVCMTVPGAVSSDAGSGYAALPGQVSAMPMQPVGSGLVVIHKNTKPATLESMSSGVQKPASKWGWKTACLIKIYISRSKTNTVFKANILMISAGRGRVSLDDVTQSSVVATPKQAKQGPLLTACRGRVHLPQQSSKGQIPTNISRTTYGVATQDQSIINNCFG